jgi:hypothetical protein
VQSQPKLRCIELTVPVAAAPLLATWVVANKQTAQHAISISHMNQTGEWGARHSQFHLQMGKMGCRKIPFQILPKVTKTIQLQIAKSEHHSLPRTTQLLQQQHVYTTKSTCLASKYLPNN